MSVTWENLSRMEKLNSFPIYVYSHFWSRQQAKILCFSFQKGFF